MNTARRVKSALATGAGAIAIALVLVLPPVLVTADEPANAALQDAQERAASQALWERGAREQCAETYGPKALLFETPEGDLACRPSAERIHSAKALSL